MVENLNPRKGKVLRHIWLEEHDAEQVDFLSKKIIPSEEDIKLMGDIMLTAGRRGDINGS